MEKGDEDTSINGISHIQKNEKTWKFSAQHSANVVHIYIITES